MAPAEAAGDHAAPADRGHDGPGGHAAPDDHGHAEPGASRVLTAFAIGHFQRARTRADARISELFAGLLVSSIVGAPHPLAASVLDVVRVATSGGNITPPGGQVGLDVIGCSMVTAARIRMGGFATTHETIGPLAADACAAAAWSTGRREGSSWPDILAAFSAGLEAQLRLARALRRFPKSSAWDVSAMSSVVGAAYVAGLLLGLDAGVLGQAVGIAASQTVGAPLITPTPAGILHSAKPAGNGVMSAYLAAEGFTGQQRVLEAHRGLFPVVAGIEALPATISFGEPELALADRLRVAAPRHPADVPDRGYLLAASLHRLLGQIDGLEGEHGLRPRIDRFMREVAG